MKLGITLRDEKIDLEIFRRISSRKERWARNLTVTALNDNRYSFEVRKTILENLPETLPVHLLKELYERFKASPDSEIAPFLARHLIMAKQKDSAKIALKQLLHNLQTNNVSKAMLYADALISHAPAKVFKAVISQENKNAY